MTAFWIAVLVMLMTALAFLTVPLVRSEHQRKTSLLTAAIIVAIVPVTAIILYSNFGAIHKVFEYEATQQHAAKVEAEIKKLGSLDNIIATLRQRVEANPDGKGWALLGRLYLKAQNFNEAVQAFRRADQLTPNQPEILVGYAQSLYFVGKQQATPDILTLLNRVLQLQPNQPDAINLLAIIAYQQHDYAKAIHYWEQLLPLLAPGSEDQNQLLQMIAAAQQQLAAQQKTTSTAPAVKLAVAVDIAAVAKAKVSPDAVVFIYAQAVSGSTAPLAITRKQVRDLPVEVTLDETMAMLPTATLADAKQVRVVARVSKTGQPLPAAGDWEAISAPFDPKHPPKVVHLLIKQQL